MSSATHLSIALANSVWQSAVFVAVVGIATRIVRGTAAQRYALWAAVLVACAALPILDATVPARNLVLPTAFVHIRGSAVPTPGESVPDDAVARRPAHVAPARSEFSLALLVSAIVASSPAILVTSIAIALARLVYLAAGYVRLRKVKAATVPCAEGSWLRELAGGVGRPLTIGTTAQLSEPCVIGFIRPAIALPEGLDAVLSPGAIANVVRHEREHVRRWDDIGNLVQHVVTAIFWFNPFVHFVARRIELDREVACDDAVAADRDERIDFAQSLLTLLALRTRRPSFPAVGSVRTRSDVARRVTRLLDIHHQRSLGVGTMGRIAVLALLCAVPAVAYVRLGASADTAATAQAVVVPHYGTWSMKIKSSGMVEPTLAGRTATSEWSFGSDAALSSFTGLSEDALRGSDRRVAFTSQRDAGSLAFTGRAGNGSGAGTFAYVPNPRFGRELAERGIAGMTDEDQFQLTLADASLRTIDALRKAGYDGSVQAFLSAAERGVDTSQLGALAALGLRPSGLDELVRLRDNEITPQYIASLRGTALQPTLDDAIDLHQRGVQPEYVRGLRALGYDPTVAELEHLAEHGISIERIRHIRPLLRDSSLENIISVTDDG